MNRVTLYSNGTGVFDRTYTFVKGEPLKVSLPIRKEALDEVIASIGVFGDVTLPEPPSFTPMGANDTRLELSPNDVIRDLAMKLRGAQVVIATAEETVRGKLAGVETHREWMNQTMIERLRLAVFDESGALRTIADREIVSLQFADAEVQAEIDKALQQAFENIKPESAFLNLTIAPNAPEVESARIQYAVAGMGAWKISYRLRCQGSQWELEGQAIVDNSTDEPWENFIVKVVTGQPVSFATDLAEIRQVQRARIEVVDDQALEGFTVAEALDAPAVMLASLDFAPAAAPMQRSAMRRLKAESGEFQEIAYVGKRAAQAQAEVKEAAGVVEYTSPTPVSVGANRSAIVPMFFTELGEAKSLLVYKQEQHPRHPYRAVRFQNGTGQSLGRGVCTIFSEEVYVGKAILEATKPEEERTLPYALESGVTVHVENIPAKERWLQVQVGEGVAVIQKTLQMGAHYHIKNNATEAFTLEIERAFLNAQSEVVVTLSPEAEITRVAIADGERLAFALPAKSAFTLKATETALQKERITLASAGYENYGWHTLYSNYIQGDGRIASDPAVQECLRRQQALAQVQKELAEAERETHDLIEEQERLKGLLTVGGHEKSNHEWRTTLANNEKRISHLKKAHIPGLRTIIQAAQNALQEAFNALTLTIVPENKSEDKRE